MTGRIFTRLLLSFALVICVETAALEMMHAPRRGLAVGVLLSTVAAAALAWFLARQLGRRLERLAVFAGRLAGGDLSARVEESDVDEVSSVAHALNSSARRLERRFAELEGKGRQLSALLDSMQEAVIAINSQGQVSWSNAAMQNIAPTPVQGGRALAHSIRDPEVLAAVALALNEHQARRARTLSIAPGRIFEVNAAPMPDGGAVAVLHDVSEIERSETARRDFVANVSHEMRTPLTCITGYVETLLEDPSLTGQNREFLDIILKNASRMNRLTEDLLALASVESGDYKPRLQLRRAAGLVEDGIASLAGLVAESGLALDMAETTEENVLVDPDAFNQILGNLIENAVKYGGSGGRILVGAQKQEGLVEFYVRDFGPGIAYEHAGRIFERFYRVDRARSRESGGTGLGLAIAKHIVLAHGGTIRCESDLGFGATFLFSLPMGPPAAGLAPAVESTNADERFPAQVVEKQ